MAEKPKVISETDAMQTCLDALATLQKEEQVRVLSWLQDKLGLGPQVLSRPLAQTAPTAAGGLSSPSSTPQGDVSAKAFLANKKPKTDAERVTCLGFYLATYRATEHFKTFDITKLNREAAQPPLSNATVAVGHAATRYKYLAAVGNGKKQVTVRGEALVNALPDREAVTAALAEHPLSATRKKSGKALPRAKS